MKAVVKYVVAMLGWVSVLPAMASGGGPAVAHKHTESTYNLV
jgi:hypothetical protein